MKLSEKMRLRLKRVDVPRETLKVGCYGLKVAIDTEKRHLANNATISN